MIGVTIPTKNCLSQDYCLEECLESIMPIAEQVVVVDVQSDDGTLEWLKAQSARWPKLQIVSMLFDPTFTPKEKWQQEDIEKASNENWFVRAVNVARWHLKTPIHLAINADEVLHQGEYVALSDHAKMILDSNGTVQVVECPTIDFWKDSRQYCHGNLVSKFGLSNIVCQNEGANMRSPGHHVITDKFAIWHYGFLRDFEKWTKKLAFMQSSFGVHFNEDFCKSTREEALNKWAPMLSPFEGNHPEVIIPWLKRHGYEL